MKSASPLAVLILLLSSCDPSRVYEDNRDFKKRAWMVDDTAIFEFRIPDSNNRYNLHYNIRNSIDYPYARIFVNSVLQDSSGAVLSKQLLGNYLFDVKTGKPFGRSGLGDIYDHSFPIIENYDLKPGLYHLKLQQFMREDTLKGILAAGVRVERIGPEVSAPGEK